MPRLSKDMGLVEKKEEGKSHKADFPKTGSGNLLGVPGLECYSKGEQVRRSLSEGTPV